ncbi:hypothetical protein SAMN05216203_0564 [Marinobacter daqiaonensis]|uniref:Uncharacterized protein n=1 Tax=Marinobacter daqiaonensis TaxID=650891 RepID=A0A1I6GWY5_9GAMM|nr:hypothetical protein [Marinobacter daqiaonensis]SFR46773.1 hypothetical protein SAMN05216203_0564 [Marinobacter daqiaonensis]
MVESMVIAGLDAETQTAYALFWGIYVVGFVLFYWAMSRLIRWIPLYGLRTLVKALLIVVIATPVQSTVVDGWWVPAWLFGGYETLMGDPSEAARAYFNMGVAALIMALVWILDLVRYRFTRR